MSTERFTPEFKEEAVRQIVERNYSVAEVSARLGVSALQETDFAAGKDQDSTVGSKSVLELMTKLSAK